MVDGGRSLPAAAKADGCHRRDVSSWRQHCQWLTTAWRMTVVVEGTQLASMRRGRVAVFDWTASRLDNRWSSSRDGGQRWWLLSMEVIIDGWRSVMVDGCR